VRALFYGLGGASPGNANNEDADDEDPTPNTKLAVECANCLREMVQRGMDDRKKVMMMTELGILGSLYELTRSETVVGGGCRLDLVTSNATQIEAVAAAAELINACGLALIQGWEQDMTSLSLVVQMEQCLHLPLTCLSYDSIDVSGAVINLVSQLLVSIERRGKEWNVSLGSGSGGGECLDD